MQSSSRFERVKLRKTALTIRTPDEGEESARRNPDQLGMRVDNLKNEDSSEWAGLSPSDFSTPKIAGMEVLLAPATPPNPCEPAVRPPRR
jgi:hypothetical protein